MMAVKGKKKNERWMMASPALVPVAWESLNLRGEKREIAAASRVVVVVYAQDHLEENIFPEKTKLFHVFCEILACMCYYFFLLPPACVMVD